MPKKKSHVPGRGLGKNNKKKNKYKPTPVEGTKKDEEEKTEVSDKDDQGDSSTDTPSGHENGPAQVENPVAVAAPDEPSSDRDVQPTNSIASCTEPPTGQESSEQFIAREHPEGASESLTPIVSDNPEPKPDSAAALMPVVTPFPRPALSLPHWPPTLPSVPGFALNAAPRAPFRPRPPPPHFVIASRSFSATERPHPPPAIKQEDLELPVIPVLPSPESVMKHPLANRWTLWWFCSGSHTDWALCQKKVSTVSTVEDFWALFHHIQPASELKTGNDYSLFKEGIMPLWEHKRNRSGGRWLYAIGPGMTKRDALRLDECWREALLLLIGEDYGDDKMRSMVNGVVINLRKMDKLAVWMDNVGEPEVYKFGLHFQRAIGARPSTLIYEAHQDTMVKSGSSARATYKI